VANFRCNEVKEECIALIQEDITVLKKVCEASVMADFGDKCLVLKDKALKHFDDETSHYKQSVYEKIRGEVIKEIFQSLLTCFDQ